METPTKADLLVYVADVTDVCGGELAFAHFKSVAERLRVARLARIVLLGNVRQRKLLDGEITDTGRVDVGVDIELWTSRVRCLSKELFCFVRDLQPRRILRAPRRNCKNSCQISQGTKVHVFSCLNLEAATAVTASPLPPATASCCEKSTRIVGWHREKACLVIAATFLGTEETTGTAHVDLLFLFLLFLLLFLGRRGSTSAATSAAAAAAAELAELLLSSSEDLVEILALEPLEEGVDGGIIGLSLDRGEYLLDGISVRGSVASSTQSMYAARTFIVVIVDLLLLFFA